MDLAKIADLIKLNPPASAESIAAVSGQLPAELPEEYAAFLAQADGAFDGVFILYSCKELPERNATFQVGLYATGYVMVGDDGGGQGIMLRGGPGRSPVFLVGHVSMRPEDMERIADSLAEWIEAGCPLCEDD